MVGCKVEPTSLEQDKAIRIRDKNVGVNSIFMGFRTMGPDELT